MKHLDSFSNFSKSGISIPYEDPNFWILSNVGVSKDEIMSTFKIAIKKIPFVGDIISILDFLVMGIGLYLAIEPTIKKIS